MISMYRLKIYTGTLCFTLVFNSIIGIAAKSCNPSDLVHSQCHDTQICDEKTAACQCRPGLEPRNDTYCVSVNHQNTSTPNTLSLVDNHGSGSIVAGILVPLFLILFVIYAVYASRKYKLVGWFRRKIHQRNNNYDEFMIGHDQDPDDDDPPLR